MDYKSEIAKLVSQHNFSYQNVYSLLTAPKDIAMGDIALPCFKFAKMLQTSPITLAENLAESLILPPFIKECRAVGGYLNFKYDFDSYAKRILDTVISQSTLYGNSKKGTDKTICIDYSSVNIAKPFHIGHLSTTVIGAALYRLYKALGYTVVGINHLGDWGTQF